MIDGKELSEVLATPLMGLNIDADFFQQNGEFSIYDCYPVIEGETYRIRAEVDLFQGMVVDVTCFKRGLDGDSDVEIDPLPALDAVKTSFVATLSEGIQGVLNATPALKGL